MSVTTARLGLDPNRAQLRTPPLYRAPLSVHQLSINVLRASNLRPGVSFICAFLPQGAALLVLGWLERWVWTNDRRIRTFYCTPRRAALTQCASSRHGADCFGLAAVQPCLDDMLARALTHVRRTWPSLRGGLSL